MQGQFLQPLIRLHQQLTAQLLAVARNKKLERVQLHSQIFSLSLEIASQQQMQTPSSFKLLDTPIAVHRPSLVLTEEHVHWGALALEAVQLCTLRRHHSPNQFLEGHINTSKQRQHFGIIKLGLNREQPTAIA
jgi:hypothetical protein